MFYCEIHRHGQVNFYELSRTQLLTKTTIEAHGGNWPVPLNEESAVAFWRSEREVLERFDTLAAADAWADAYSGFRAGEVRAELARFAARRAQRLAAEAAA
jgi:hypothetical protein